MSTDLTPLLVLAKRLCDTLARQDDPVAAMQAARAQVIDLYDAIAELRRAVAGDTCLDCNGTGTRRVSGLGIIGCRSCGGTGKAE